MINFLSSWAEKIIIAVVISSIIEMILPDNKNKKYVKMVMGIYILFNIISPMINQKDLLSLDSFNFESYAVTKDEPQSKELNQSSMDERLQQLYVEELENNIKTKAEEEGYKVYSCKVDATLYGKENEQGINKVALVVSEKQENSNDTTNKKSDIQTINKVQINVGLNKFLNNVDEEIYNSNDNENGLRDFLSNYYQIDGKKISISIHN